MGTNDNERGAAGRVIKSRYPLQVADDDVGPESEAKRILG
jgi:hypothetical protein